MINLTGINMSRILVESIWRIYRLDKTTTLLQEKCRKITFLFQWEKKRYAWSNVWGKNHSIEYGCNATFQCTQTGGATK